jgi:hypothetical protein
VFKEDQPERIPGPALVDYLGLPINAAARQWALSWNPDRLTLQEHQCHVHTVAYIYRIFHRALGRQHPDGHPRTSNRAGIGATGFHPATRLR